MTFKEFIEDTGVVGATTPSSWGDGPNGREFKRVGIRSNYVSGDEENQKLGKPQSSAEELYFGVEPKKIVRPPLGKFKLDKSRSRIQ